MREREREEKGDNTLQHIRSQKAAEQRTAQTLAAEKAVREAKERREAAATALPPNWREVVDKASGRPYWWNVTTQETSWCRPAPLPVDAQAAVPQVQQAAAPVPLKKQQPENSRPTTEPMKAEPLPEGWTAFRHAASGQTFYLHAASGARTTKRPAAAADATDATAAATTDGKRPSNAATGLPAAAKKQKTAVGPRLPGARPR